VIDILSRAFLLALFVRPMRRSQNPPWSTLMDEVPLDSSSA